MGKHRVQTESSPLHGVLVRRRGLQPVAALLLVALSAVACEKVTTYVLVRHAEPAAGVDPPLSLPGGQRAHALIDVMRQSHVAVVFHSQFVRTTETAESVATALNVPRIEIPVTAGQEQVQVDSTLRHVRSTFAGRTVLIVGHSNTVPLAVSSLGVANAPPIGPNDFHHLFIVVKHGSNPGKLIHARYGQ
ncbi:MAG: histidine phosphatase family protein [Gemmatimonadaceae bacterium]